MSRYLIKKVECEVVGGGPMPGTVIAAIQYECDGVEKWIHIVEVEGMPNAYIRDDDVFDVLIRDDYDADYVEELERTSENEIGGISLTAEGYEDIFDELHNNEDATEEDKSFIRFILAIVRCDWDIVDELKTAAIGKYTDELDIPISEDEEEYLEELEEE